MYFKEDSGIDLAELPETFGAGEVNSAETDIQSQIKAEMPKTVQKLTNSVVWNNSLVSSGPTSANSLFANTDFYHVAKAYSDNWLMSFDYIKGPLNPAFNHATLDYRDIANGLHLEYNPNGILWKVNDAGIPSYEDLNKYFEQNRIIKETNDRALVVITPIVNDLQAAESPISTTSVSGVLSFSTEASDPKKRIGNYYQEAGIFYKVTAVGPQEVSLNEVKYQRVWSIAEDGTAGWWTVDEKGLLNWGGITGSIRTVGDALWQIGPDGKDNYYKSVPSQKSDIGNMTPSDKLTDFIAAYEDMKDRPYRVTPNDPLTIGYGHVIQAGEDYSNGISEEDAKKLLLRQITQEYAPIVNRWAANNNVQLTQQQFDALVSFVYNAGGIDVPGETETIARVVKSGNATPDEIRQAFGLYINGADGPLPGLILRRRDEADMFLEGDYRRKP